MNSIPLIVIFAATSVLIILFIEIGYRAGYLLHRRRSNEKEPPVAAISAAIFGLLAFMLAFTFGIVSDKFEARKAVLRDEANSIGTLYLRTSFVPEPDRTKARELIRKYVALRLDVFKTLDDQHIAKSLSEATEIQDQLWNMATAHAQTDMNSPTGSLYFQSLNEVIDMQSMRVAVAYQTQIPSGIWLALYCLLMLGMFSIGYATAFAESSRTIAILILALSFSLVITLIAAMDGIKSNYINISQQPMEDVRENINSK